MRYLGLDLGTKTIGLAISDKTALIATSYSVLHHDNNPNSCLDDLINIINKEQIDALVLGLPKNMNNTSGEAALRSISFKEKLSKLVDIPIILVDERLSTIEAENILLTNDMSRKKRKSVIDSAAAMIILDTYLRMEKNNGNK